MTWTTIETLDLAQDKQKIAQYIKPCDQGMEISLWIFTRKKF